MEGILIFLKHHFKFLWKIIEKVNAFVFFLFYSGRLNRLLPVVFQQHPHPPYLYRKLDKQEEPALYRLIQKQDESDLKYFSPHGFDHKSLKQQFKNRSLLMMGAFDGEKLIGYFFLRFFANKKCFVGRLIDKEYRGKGIGLTMNKLMYETAWGMSFRCYSTISNNNKAVIKAHAKNSSMKILKELANDYLLVEFTREETRS